MRETLQSNNVEEKRNQYLNRFCLDLMNAIKNPKSSQDVITWIDDVFTKLRRFVRNNSKIKPTQDKLKWIDKLFMKIREFIWEKPEIKNNVEFQKNVFIDICHFLNGLNGNFEVRKFHNSISKTPIEKYKDMTLWEQFYNNAFGEWNFEFDCKWWSCSNWTLSLYKFFDALREAGLDIKISIYRLKNTEDDFVWMQSMRHSWLVINFRWVDYMIDYEWINDAFSWNLIQSVNRLKDEVKKFWIKNTKPLDDLKMENRNRYNSRNNNDSMLIHFKNDKDFFDDVKAYPPLKKISFINYQLKKWEPTRLCYQFFNGWIFVEVDNYYRYFILKKDAQLKRDKKEFFNSLVENSELIMDEVWTKKITQEDKEELANLLRMIEGVIELDYVISEYK